MQRKLKKEPEKDERRRRKARLTIFQRMAEAFGAVSQPIVSPDSMISAIRPIAKSSENLISQPKKNRILNYQIKF